MIFKKWSENLEITRERVRFLLSKSINKEVLYEKNFEHGFCLRWSFLLKEKLVFPAHNAKDSAI